ncbi:PucR family transcriptional regulator [Solirubrobacter soli]|uniref:PucR family transcriptional regulator n=1 Tax=Solirubrobacter soli TaxID=363832 RepID=UPI0012F9A142|nr:helix-turn-helix domain-containing protein [Solirubrobacter soli]
MNVQGAVDAVARAVRRREDELVATMLERFAQEVSESGVGEDPDMAAAMRESSYANLRAAMERLGERPLPSGPPADAIEEARTSAQAGVPLAALLQTYRIGQAVAWDAILDAAGELDESIRAEVLRVCTHYSFAYVDAVIPYVTEEYTRERDRLVRSREQRRVQLVRDLLDGGDVHSGDLGYELTGTHRAAIAWGPGAEPELARLADELRVRLLVVAATGQTVWGWLGGGEDRALRAAIRPWPGGLAFGRPADGPDGFRDSHGQARAAHRIGVATGAPVTHFDDVALESVLLADEDAARAFIAGELAALGSGRDGAKLRETLSAYFASGFNASAAAAQLRVNDRTVAYRLNRIEELLGRPVRTRQAELQAAIRLERILK